MHHAEPVVLLFVLVAGLVILANKWAVPYPVLLVLGGLALSLVPFLPVIRLDPNLVLFFFLPPLGNFTIADPQNWVALFAFLVTSITGSRLSSRIRREADIANRRRREIEHLYAFSQKLLGEGNVIRLMNAIPNYIVDCFEAGAAELFVPQKEKFYRSGYGAEPHPETDVVNPDRIAPDGPGETPPASAERLACPRCGSGRLVAGPDGSTLTCEHCHYEQPIHHRPDDAAAELHADPGAAS
jgi:ribosomal protein S27AE